MSFFGWSDQFSCWPLLGHRHRIAIHLLTSFHHDSKQSVDEIWGVAFCNRIDGGRQKFVAALNLWHGSWVNNLTEMCSAVHISVCLSRGALDREAIPIRLIATSFQFVDFGKSCKSLSLWPSALKQKKWTMWHSCAPCSVSVLSICIYIYIRINGAVWCAG